MWLDELPDDALDTEGRAPLHARLTAVLRTRLTDGSLPSGTQFPTEAELQDRFGVSRSVVRQSLLALTAEGLLQRGRGRGSVVAPRGEHHRLVQRISGLSTQVPEVTTRVLSIGREREASAEAALATSEVLAIRRLRSAAGEPIALIHTWLPLSLASTLTSEELTDTSLHATVRKRFGVTVVAGRRQVRAVAASESIARSLEVAEGSPVLLLEGTSVDDAGTAVETFRTWHRADRVVFDLDVVRSESTTGSATVSEAPLRHRTDVATSPHSVAAESGATRSDAAARARSLARELDELADELAASRSDGAPDEAMDGARRHTSVTRTE